MDVVAVVEDARARIDEFNKLLRLPPETAAAQIVRAIERRAPRLIIGDDARLMATIRAVFPVGYWKKIEAISGI